MITRTDTCGSREFEISATFLSGGVVSYCARNVTGPTKPDGINWGSEAGLPGEGVRAFSPNCDRVKQRVGNHHLQSVRAWFDESRNIRAVGSEQKRGPGLPINPDLRYVANLAQIEQHSFVPTHAGSASKVVV